MNHTVKVFQPAGILDGMSAERLRLEINDAVTSGANIILLDLQDVPFINSSGLGALVAATKMVRTSGSKIFVCSLKEQVKMLFELTRIDEVIKTFTDRKEFNRQVLAIEQTTD
jgi:anti-anti-sigma factor